MRTKALLTVAALAAGALTTMAQSNVYSLNVVGYVNKTFPASGYALVTAPLDPGTNNLTSIIPSAPLGSQVLTWNATLQDYDATIPAYSTKQAKWIPDPTIAPGSAFFVLATGNFTNTFVGNVRQGALSTPIVGNGAVSIIGSQVPLGGSLTTNVLASYPGTLGDQVLTWNVGLQDFDATIPAYATKTSKWIPDPSVDVGDGFVLIRTGTAITYTRNFTVQ